MYFDDDDLLFRKILTGICALKRFRHMHSIVNEVITRKYFMKSKTNYKFISN